MARSDSQGLHGKAVVIFRGLARSYDRVVDSATFYQDRRWKNWVARNLGAGHGSLALDLGCGTLLLEERISGRGWTFVGVDLTREMATLGNAKGLGNVSAVVAGDAEMLPFSDMSFDAVVGCYVPKYVNLAKLAGEVGRVCKPGAVVIFYDFARPRGLFAPFLNLYIYAGLRLVGRALALLRKSEARTFAELPGIISGTNWDTLVPDVMGKSGFGAIEAKPLTGGAVFAYCGKKT